MKLFAENFKLDKLDLTSASGKVVGLGQQLLAMRIQEDITTPFIACEIDIADGIGLLQTFPIIGEEILDVTINLLDSYELDGNNTASIKYQFYIYAVSDVGINEKSTASVYTLKGISKEAIINASRLTEKAYKSTYDAVVKDTISTLLESDKTVYADTSLGVQEVVLPNMKPFQALDMIRKRATSSKHPHSPFVLFETRNGFKFRDVLSLFEDGKAQPIKDITYMYRNFQTDMNHGENDRKSLISFSSPEKYDTYSKINNGAFNNKILTYDLITKTLKPYTFDLSAKMESFDTFNKSQPHTDVFVKSLSSTPSRTFLIPFDSTRPDLFVDRFGERVSYTNLIFQHYSQAEMNGNVLLEAGGVVYLDMRMDLPSIERGKDVSNSGYYLIKSITHEIHIINGVPMYRAGCDLIRGSMLEKLK